jgi:hypothetical protein
VDISFASFSADLRLGFLLLILLEFLLLGFGLLLQLPLVCLFLVVSLRNGLEKALKTSLLGAFDALFESGSGIANSVFVEVFLADQELD